MTQNDLHAVTLYLVREVARLHASTAVSNAVIRELRIRLPELASIDALQIQKDAWQEFWTRLEDWKPALAAFLDNRPPEAFE